MLLRVAGIDQADQRAELNAFSEVVGKRAELAPIGQGLAYRFGAPDLAGGQVGGFESQCVVLVFGNVFFMGRRFTGRPYCLFGLQQVFGEPFQHLLLQHEFIHDDRQALQTGKGTSLDYEGILQLSNLRADVQKHPGTRPPSSQIAKGSWEARPVNWVAGSCNCAKAPKVRNSFISIDFMTDLISKLNWRYATKKMDSAKVVPQEKVDRILEAIRLTASSSGLQPYEVIVVSNKEMREKIKPVAWNQEQITDGSHLLVFAAWDNYTAERINMMFDLVNDQRGFKSEGWENYRQMLLGSYVPREAEVNYQHAARQAYIGLGTALIAAAEEEVDATPMEGFDPKAVDALLNLRERGLRSVVLMPLGYRAQEGDWLVNLKKVRRDRSAFVTEVA